MPPLLDLDQTAFPVGGAKLTSSGAGQRQPASLIAAAVAAGRLPGEPATVLVPPIRRSLLRRIFGGQEHSPLADPRLEVVRAISASLSRGVAQIQGDLLAAAFRTGLTRDELARAFPGVAIEASSA